jgi:hypothetical protein
MYAEFKDAQCKESLIPHEGEPLPTVFTSCDKHKTQDVIEFIISERLEEAVEAAQVSPVVMRHLHPLPEDIEEGDMGGVTASGESVQSVMKVAKPKAVGRERANNLAPPPMKTLSRSPEQLAKSGASFKGGGAVEMQVDEVEEDDRITPHIEDVMDFLDPKESGLINDDED